jgi:CheY-like chemotaxis protein/anti-sigma regulatory factor (Ser/Thr protein kinase)
LAFIKQQALTKRIQLIPRIPKHLPEIMLDERRIRQVLINLLNNAVKFTLEGGTITLEVSQVRLERNITNPTSLNYLKIAVIDTGIGITAENIQKLFQPFIQIDSALNRQYTGTGLGLTLVKRLVELHGGTVELTSELGVGSCFAINLPFNIGSSAIEEQTKSDLSEQSQIGQSPTEALISPLILLAEDNEANIGTFSSYLEAKGYRILLAIDGQQAIDLAKLHHPDLILMDIQMPVIDGMEAIKLIRLNPDLVDIPIIALTALAMTGDRERCLEAGANDYLSKPIKLKQLAATIQQLL